MAAISKQLLWRALREFGIRRRPASDQRPVLEHPVVGWMAGSVSKDGLLEVAGLHRWHAACESADPCPLPAQRLVGTGGGMRALVEAKHECPGPFCSCGLSVSQGRPARGWLDVLGRRAQTCVVVAVWGRVIVEHDRVRGQHGRVLALTVDADEWDRRRARLQCAADQLGVPLIELPADAGSESFDAVAEGSAAGVGRPLTLFDCERALRRRAPGRRWRSGDVYPYKRLELVLTAMALLAVLTGWGLVALGVPVAVAVGLPSVASIAFAVEQTRRTARSMVQLEVLVADPDGLPSGSLIAVRPRQHVLAGLVRSVLALLGRELQDRQARP